MALLKPSPLEFVENDQKQINHHIRQNSINSFKTSTQKILLGVAFPESHGVIKNMVFSAAGNVLVVTYASGIIELRDFPEGRTLRAWQFSQAPATCVRFHPEQEDLVFTSHADGVIRRFRLEPKDDSGNIFVEEKYDVNAVDLSYSGNFLASASKNKRIKIYDAETKKTISVFKASPTNNKRNFHSSPVVAVCWFPEDNNILTSAGWDNTIRVWDIRNSTGSVMIFKGPNILSSDGIDISGNHLIAGGWSPDDALTLWHLKVGRKLRSVNVSNRKMHEDGQFLYCAKFWKSFPNNADGRYVITGGSGTKNVEMVDLMKNSIVCNWPKYGAVTTLTSKDSSLAWGGSSPVIGLAEYHQT